MKVPTRLGAFAISISDTIEVFNNKGQKILTIEPPKATESLGINKPVLSATVITLGEMWRRYYGNGTTVERTYTGTNRTITLSVECTDFSVVVDFSVAYTQDTEVEQEGVSIKLRYYQGLDYHSDAAITPLDYAGELGCYTDHGDYRQNFVFSDAGVKQYDSYQSRLNGKTYQARLEILKSDKIIPLKVLLQPNGREATLLFTNHADGENVNSTSAILYGTSDALSPDYGTKGLIGNSIFCTWSAFHETAPPHTGISTAEFLALMQAIKAAGFDVIPHRTRPGNTETRANAESNLPAFNTNFASRDWIDHGLGAGARNIGLKSLGSVVGSGYYIMDLLETYGYKYCWAYIDCAVDGLNQLKKHYAGFPDYLVYQNTNLALPISGEPLWQWLSWRPPLRTLLDYLTTENVDALISEFGCSIIHEYLAIEVSGATHAGYTYNSGTPYTITNNFETMLNYLRDKQVAGNLWIAPMSDFGDYFRQLLQVEVKTVGQGQYKITNNGAIVSGFSIAVPGVKSVTVDSVAVDKKVSGANTVAWWNLKVGVSEVVCN